MINKVISGGQTGIDRLGLEIAKELGIKTGGTAPPGFYTENGYDESLKDFNLQELKDFNNSNFYRARTGKNVFDSDGTVYFKTDSDSAGFLCTKNFSIMYKKPFIVNPTINELIKWIDENQIKVLNVAGNRESKLSNELKELADKVLRNSLTKSNSSQLTLSL